MDIQDLWDLVKRSEERSYDRIIWAAPEKNAPPLNRAPRLVVLDEGEGDLFLSIDGKALNVQVGTGTLVYGLPGASTGSGEVRSSFRTLAVIFLPDYIRIACYAFSPDKMHDSLQCFVHLRIIPPALRPLLAAMNALGTIENTPGNKDCGIHTAKALLAQVYSLRAGIEAGENMGKAASSWRKIEHHLSHHLQHDLTRRRVAAEFRMNESYLSSLCHQQTGRTFNAYVNELRLEQAVLLLELNLSLDEITERCGFCYTSYFIRLFKARYGTSPGKFRINQIHAPTPE